MTSVNNKNWLGLLAMVSLLVCARPGLAQEEGDEIGPGEPAPALPTPPPPTKDKSKLMRKLMKIIRAEPSITSVQNWATSHYKLETGRINGMASKARLKAFLPDISGSYDNMVGNNFSNMRDGLFPILPNLPENPNPNNLKERTVASNDQKTWRVSATWNLDRLVFNPEALDAKSLTSLQENLVREVTTMYFARRRVLASLIINPPKDPEQYFYEIQRLEEMTATLDAFTGRNFGRRSWQWDTPGWENKRKKKKSSRFGLPSKRFTSR